MGSVGLPEALVVVFVLAVWALPIAAGIWALVTLHRIRQTLDQMDRRLARIETQTGG